MASSTTTSPGTADEHRRRAPSKNLIVAATDFAEELGLPLNLGGGVKPGDGLEEFKRGFANTELPYRTHELICDREVYERAVGGDREGDFFPLYRSRDNSGQMLRFAVRFARPARCYRSARASGGWWGGASGCPSLRWTSRRSFGTSLFICLPAHSV